MGMLEEINSEIRLQEEVEQEILLGIETNEKQQDNHTVLGLLEMLPGGYATAARAREGERTAARDLQVGHQAQQETLPAAIRTQSGQTLPVKVYQSRQDGSMVFGLRGQYYLAPATAVSDGNVQGRMMKIIDPAAVQKVQ